MAETPTSNPGENPSSGVESPEIEKKRISLIIQHSDAVAEELDIEDTQNWKTLMDTLAADIPSPAGSAIKSDILQNNLHRKFENLKNQKMIATKLLIGAVAYSQDAQKLTSLRRATILRSVARYLDELDVYNHLLLGKVPLNTSILPTYLAPYVASREAEQIVAETTGKILAFQYDVQESSKLALSPPKINPGASEILINAVRFDVKLESFLSPDGTCIKDKASCERLLAVAGFTLPDDQKWPQEDVDEVLFVSGFLQKNMKAIQEYADFHKRDVKKLNIAEVLECCLQNAPMLAIMDEVVSNAKQIVPWNFSVPDMRDFLKGFYENKDLFSQKAVEIALIPLAKLYKGDKTAKNNGEKSTMFENDVKVVLEFFRSSESKGTSIKEIEPKIQNLTDEQKELIRGVYTQVVGQETDPQTGKVTDHAAETIQRLCKVSFVFDNPDDFYSKAIAAKLTQLIRDKKLSTKDTFDLYYLSQMKGGELMLAYKVVAILDEHGESELAKEQQMRLLRKMKELAFSDPEKFKQIANEMGVSPEHLAELENVKKYLAEKGIGKLQGIVDSIFAFYRNFPEFAIPLGIIIAAPYAMKAGMGAYTIYRKCVTSEFSKFSTMGTAEIRAKYGLSEEMYTDTQIEAARTAAGRIMTKIDLMKHEWNWPLEKGRLVGDGTGLIEALKSSDLNAMAVKLKRTLPYAQDLANALYDVADSEQSLRTAVESAGFTPAETDLAVKKVVANRVREGKPLHSQAAPSATVSSPSPASQPKAAPSVQTAPAAKPAAAPATQPASAPKPSTAPSTVPAPPPAPKPAAAPSTAPAAAPSQGPATSPSSSLPKPPPPPAAPKRGAYFNPKARNAPVSQADLILTQQVPLADVQKIAAEAGITVDGKSEAEIRAEVAAKVKGRK